MYRVGYGPSPLLHSRLLGSDTALLMSLQHAAHFTGALGPCRRVSTSTSHHCAATCLHSAAAMARRHAGSASRRFLPPPPPLGGSAAGRTGSFLPPPPPLSSARLSPAHGGGTSHSASMHLLSPQEVASTFVLYVPTFYVSFQCVASLLPDAIREEITGRGRLVNFFKKFPFIFDVLVVDSGRINVRLHPDLIHPQRGVADDKYMMSDVGQTTSYVVKPEFIVCAENIESNGMQRVLLTPPAPPPAMRVRLEERVPVLDRLRSLVPAEFTAIDALEESISEDILFHPYFNCQGGLFSIAGKMPEEFQVVDGRIRRRPPHLAPLALDEFTLDTSPLPEVAALIKRHVCDSDIPHWVSITPLYEQLTRAQKQEIKRRYRSFAGFLRAHGRSLAVSTDMLQVSMWIFVSSRSPPTSVSANTAAAVADDQVVTARDSSAATPSAASLSQQGAPSEPSLSPAAAGGSSGATCAPPTPAVYTREQVLNAWYDRFPPYKTLSLRDAMQLLPVEMRASGLPTKIAPWLATHPHYFSVDFAEEEDPAKVLIRRASERQPLDLAAALYANIPDKDTPCPSAEVLQKLDPSVRRVIEGIGLLQLGRVLPQWLLIEKCRGGGAGVVGGPPQQAEFTIRRLQDMDALEKAQRRDSKGVKRREMADVDAGVAELEESVTGA
ncbi:conserved hypothetical protein [Leishmania mexicana MHOM/GT/2001/U1103]|uniref:Uncharacterized protein n=1 Tax=Leishmania mexicana (strain MHOM/GT/2001/U1103) TaxID=929439 RepID=E9B0H2_LEIMU|nr:conserved hypothetical protein [Leishmania mexicana MHOM/GT/2001/U1103]CBZ28726.1 conserved hypothetical protein [Leishmania mexicana MHOM/GT/2001/U1103]